jgi:hypothetical protein
MKYDKAVQMLRTIAERCHQVNQLWDEDEESPLIAAYAFGAVLDGPDEVAQIGVALVLDAPSGELTWGARPLAFSGLPHLLELDQPVVDWCWRPEVWPVANHVIVRPLRVWSRRGVDTAALDALADRAAEPLRLPAPDREDAQEQAAFELAESLAHVRRVTENYWEPDWRRDNRGYGSVHPEHQLWRAVRGFLDLRDAPGAQGDAAAAV